ncbi:hypothetical protein BU24DRAFT_415288 [Aaosphaeria arxii CBS 175.79]|uniref:Uncharacterized protein n=1 Tax=Aaosphaeria arxii CBS 175.79 TaxID=1450172 RepID=A0A6A5X845_9PLEO|nr:uncharacterized protein BU24DRAFT_415288 [Aaosphaeria arxii CBS 175.79]KAF2008924.1 hypothetical protein BU24DRAFT_415288 [Aaosphaeria arxii CBS 175.79]
MSSPAESAGSGPLPRSSSEQERVDAKDNNDPKTLRRSKAKARDKCMEFTECLHHDVTMAGKLELKFSYKIRSVCGAAGKPLHLVSQIMYFKGEPEPKPDLVFDLTPDSGLFGAWRKLAEDGVDGAMYWHTHSILFRYINASETDSNNQLELIRSDIPDGNTYLATADWSKPDGIKIIPGDKHLVLYPGYGKMDIDKVKDEDTNMDEDENLDEEL